MVGSNCFGAEQHTGTVTGKAVDDLTGSALSSVTVELLSERKQVIASTLTTAEGGMFEFLGVPYGKYTF